MVRVCESNKNAAPEPTLCLHCGEIIRYDDTHAQGSFCCTGCEKVYYFLKSQNLDDYYSHLEKLGKRAPTQANEIWQGELARQHDFSDMPKLFQISESRLSFFVPAINCAACVWIIQEILRRIEGVKRVEVIVVDRLIHIEAENPSALIGTLLETLHKTGYEAYPHSMRYQSSLRKKSVKQAVLRMGVAGAIAGNVMLLAIANYAGEVHPMEDHYRQFFNWVGFGLTTIAIVYCGQSLLQNSFNAIRTRRLHIDLPITVAILLAYAASIVSLFDHSNFVFFDSICGLLFFLLTSRFLHSSLVDKASEMAHGTRDILPDWSAALKEGDTVRVRTGEASPADGIVTRGETEFSEAAFNGESRPTLKKTGDVVYAGTHNLLHPIEIKVTHSSHNTKIAQYLEMIDKALQTKSKFTSTADRFLPWFTVGIFLMAVASAIFWWQHGNIQNTFFVPICILIVGCPCALALATPLITTIGLQRLWKEGIMVKSQSALERLSEIECLVLDKTGTLTHSELQLKETQILSNIPPPENWFRALASIAHQSFHPYSKSISHLRNSSEIKVTDVKEYAGQGMTGQCETWPEPIYLGSVAWISSLFPNLDLSKTNRGEAVVVAASASHACAFFLSQNIRESARTLIRLFQERNIPIYILSGDQKSSVENVAKQLEISKEHVFSQVTAAQKLAFIESRKEKTLMVGDGINDAAALQAAYVGVAVKGGVDIALKSADVFLQCSLIDKLFNTYRFSIYLKNTLYFTLFLSASYNFIAIYFAFFGKLHPLMAALIMPVASVSTLLIAYFRKGEKIWISSTQWCPSPLSLQPSASFGSSGE